MKEYQGWDEWVDKFNPKDNHITGQGKLYETYGEEYEYIKSLDPKYVWTYLDGDMSSILVAGVAYINRLGYYACEVPWDDDMDSVLLSVETECTCYSEDEDVMETRNDEYGDPDCTECEGYGYVTNYL